MCPQIGQEVRLRNKPGNRWAQPISADGMLSGKHVCFCTSAGPMQAGPEARRGILRPSRRAGCDSTKSPLTRSARARRLGINSGFPSFEPLEDSIELQPIRRPHHFLTIRIYFLFFTFQTANVSGEPWARRPLSAVYRPSPPALPNAQRPLFPPRVRKIRRSRTGSIHRAKPRPGAKDF